MTLAEWNNCQDPFELLVVLRGYSDAEVARLEAELAENSRVFAAKYRAKGAVPNVKALVPVSASKGGKTLLSGASAKITPQQCRKFIASCLQLMLEYPIDGESRTAAEKFIRYDLNLSLFESFEAACKDIHNAEVSGKWCVIPSFSATAWTSDPLGADAASSIIARGIANTVEIEALVAFEKSASESELEDASWGVPPIPAWKDLHKTILSREADILRLIVEYPGEESA